MQRGHTHSPSGAEESSRHSRWNHSTGQNTSFPTKDQYHFSQKHVNTARIIFQSFNINVPWYSLECDLNSFGILLQRLSLHLLLFWWTHPRGVVATFHHLQFRVFSLQVLVFLHQIDCNCFLAFFSASIIIS